MSHKVESLHLFFFVIEFRQCELLTIHIHLVDCVFPFVIPYCYWLLLFFQSFRNEALK